MTTYTKMRTRIENELKRPDLSAEVADAIKTAIQHYADEHYWFNEAVELTATVSTGAEYYSLPTDFQQFITVSLNTSNYTYQLEQKPWSFIDSVASNDNWNGRPEMFAILGEQYRLYPIPNETYTLNLSYVKELSAISSTSSLSGTSDSAWFSAADDLIRARAKADVLENVIRGPDAVQEAQLMRLREREALERIESKTTKRRSSGTMMPFY